MGIKTAKANVDRENYPKNRRGRDWESRRTRDWDMEAPARMKAIENKSEDRLDTCPLDNSTRRRIRQEIEDYLAISNFDPRASNELRHADPEVQSLVLEESIKKNARNPSALLMQRI